MSYDFFGCLFAVIGSLLLALNRPKLSKYGWPAYMVSNLAWLAFGFTHGEQWLVTQNLIFMLLNLWGIARWFRPAGAARRRGDPVDITAAVFSR